MTTVRELLTVFGIEYDDKGGIRLDSRVGSLMDRMLAASKGAAALGAAVAGAFAANAVVQGLAQMVEQTAQLGANIKDTSVKLGVATDALQELRYAAELSGGSTDLMDSSLERLSRNLAAAREGGEAAEMFRSLGIAVEDASGRTRAADEVLGDVADKLVAMEDPAKKVDTAFKLFGRSGTAMVTVLAEGREGLQALREEAHALGGVLDKELIEQADRYDDTMARWRFTMQGVRNTIANALMPAATRFVEWIIGAVKRTREFLSGTRLVEATLGTVAAILAGAGLKWLFMSGGIAKVVSGLRIVLPLLARILWPITLVLALAAAIDDLHSLFTGGKSVIGAWLDEIGGIGTAQLVVDAFKGGWELLNETIADSIQWVVDFGDQVAEAFGYIQDAGGAALDWLEQTFGVDFKAIASAAGQAAFDAFIKPWLELGEGALKMLGIDPKEMKELLGGETFDKLRERQFQRAAGAGIGAGVLAGPSQGQANASASRVALDPIVVTARGRAPAVHRTNNVTVNVTGAKDPERTGAAVERGVGRAIERNESRKRSMRREKE